jgi:hypothetical protein
LVRKDGSPQSYLSYVSHRLLYAYYRGSQNSLPVRGTLHTSSHTLDLMRGEAVKKSIITSPRLVALNKRVFDDKVLERHIQREAQHSLLKLKNLLGERMKARGGRL